MAMQDRATCGGSNCSQDLQARTTSKTAIPIEVHMNVISLNAVMQQAETRLMHITEIVSQ